MIYHASCIYQSFFTLTNCTSGRQPPQPALLLALRQDQQAEARQPRRVGGVHRRPQPRRVHGGLSGHRWRRRHGGRRLGRLFPADDAGARRDQEEARGRRRDHRGGGDRRRGEEDCPDRQLGWRETYYNNNRRFKKTRSLALLGGPSGFNITRAFGPPVGPATFTSNSILVVLECLHIALFPCAIICLGCCVTVTCSSSIQHPSDCTLLPRRPKSHYVL